jgi:AMP deaminase
MNTFADFLENIFEPLFDATRDPKAYPDVHLFLQQVIPL